MGNKKKYVSAKRADKLINELIGYLSERQKIYTIIFLTDLRYRREIRRKMRF